MITKQQTINKQQHQPFWAENNEVRPTVFVEVTDNWFADWLTR